MALLAPIPSANVRIATAANPGAFKRPRMPYRMSCAISCSIGVLRGDAPPRLDGASRQYVGSCSSVLYRLIYNCLATEQERKDRKERKETKSNQPCAVFADFAFSTAGG